MKLPRPYIPYEIRVQVAARQALAEDIVLPPEADNWSYTQQLRELLYALFDGAKVHLDHNPALQNRKKVHYSNNEFAGYDPPANDPRYLIYRTADNHRTKTLVRGDGAQHSDAALARKNKRIARNRDPKRRKWSWPKRKFSSRSVPCR